MTVATVSSLAQLAIQLAYQGSVLVLTPLAKELRTQRERGFQARGSLCSLLSSATQYIDIVDITSPHNVTCFKLLLNSYLLHLQVEVCIISKRLKS